MTILDQLAAHARQRVERDRAACPLEALRETCQALGRSEGGARFRRALAGPGLALICEVKRASPSKGLIAPDFPYLAIAEAYRAGGAAAISCLTEPKWFLGSDAIFQAIRRQVDTPMLRKDFTVDPYQIYQARAMGADCVLLLCALLDRDTLAGYLDLCRQLGLAALVEAHDEEEIAAALDAGAEIVGGNNRNLKDFTVDLTNAARLREKLPPSVLYVAESGVRGPEDIAALARAGADAALVGEALMRAPDQGAALAALRRAAG